MRRREFITLLGSAAVAGPFAARAQQSETPVIGFLRSASIADAASLVTAFREGLKETGFVDGQNVAIELRSAEGQPDRLPALVADLIRNRVAVIVGNTAAAHAAKDATSTVPIVFATGFDPVNDGLVASLNRPGANVTGVTFLGGTLGAKRLELLRQIATKSTIIGVLVYPSTPDTEAGRQDVQAAARAVGQQLVIADVRNANDIEAAFTTFIDHNVGAVLAGTGGAFFFSNGAQIAALAARYRLPTMFSIHAGVEAGGLMSYSPSIRDAYRQVGIYAGRILKGEKPADLPVMQSAKFELVINLKTAKVIGIAVPPNLLALADEVIE
ncbi:MAG: ABC transporter substrate-binding protein [Xanthobacteraceae bacterium]